MGASRARLARQVEKIGRDQREEEAGKCPKRRRTPERARQEQEEIRNLDGVWTRVQEGDSGNSERISVWEKLRAQVVQLEQDNQALNGGKARKVLSSSLHGFYNSRFLIEPGDLCAKCSSTAIDRVRDNGWRGRQRHA